MTEIRAAVSVAKLSGATAPDWDALYRAHAGGILRLVPFVGHEEAAQSDREEADLVRHALRSIPPDQATALVLRLHEGSAPGEIASMLGISGAGVKSRLVRGRRRFIEAYERMGGRL